MIGAGGVADFEVSATVSTELERRESQQSGHEQRFFYSFNREKIVIMGCSWHILLQDKVKCYFHLFSNIPKFKIAFCSISFLF